MLMSELVEWQRQMPRIQAREALLLLQIEHGKPQDIANMLTARSIGMTTDEYEKRRAKAMSIRSGLMSALGRM